MVGCESILSASQMNSAVVLFLDSIAKVNLAVVNDIVINDSFTLVKSRIKLSNVSPFIRDGTLERKLSRHGKIISKICSSPYLQHAVSFR